MKNKINHVFLIIYTEGTYARQNIVGCFGLKEDAERFINAIDHRYRYLYDIKPIEVGYYENTTPSHEAKETITNDFIQELVPIQVEFMKALEKELLKIPFNVHLFKNK